MSAIVFVARTELVCTLLLAALCASASAVAGPLCDGRDSDGDGSVDEGCPQTCADPRDGGEQVLSSTDIDATFGTDTVLIWDGAGFAAVWAEAEGFDTQVFLGRYDAGGVPFGNPTPVSPVGEAEEEPTVAWSGRGYGVAWSQSDFGAVRGAFAFVDATGTVTAGPVTIDGQEGDAQRLVIAWDEAQQHFVIAWAWYNGNVYVRRVREDGTTVGDRVCVTCALTTSVGEISLAPGAGELGIAWEDGSGKIRFARTQPDGTLIGTPYTFGAANGADHPSVVRGPGHWALAWSDRRDGNEGIYFARMGATGTPLEPEARINDSEANSWQPRLAWTGAEYVVGWAGAPTSGDNGLFLRRLDAGGAPLMATRHYPGGDGPYMKTGLAWTGERVAMLRDEWTIVPRRSVSLRLFDCCEDSDADGMSWCEGDRDDGDASVAPGASELCDGVDNDLDGSLDEGCDGVCESLALTDLSTIDTAPGRSAVALAVQRSDGRAVVARSDEPAPGEEELVLERGGPPWAPSPAETDPARSDAATLAWTGTRVGVLFVDERAAPGSFGLRFSAQDDAGNQMVDDVDLGLEASGSAGLDGSWDGRRLAGTWTNASDEALWTRVDASGARMQRGVAPRGAGGSGDLVREAAMVPERSSGGIAMALLEERAGGLAVLLERHDTSGGLVGSVGELAAPASGRAEVRLVATGSGYVAAWTEAAGSPARPRVFVVRADASGLPISTPFELSPGASGDATLPELAFTGEEVVVTWRDTRSGTPLLHAARLAPDGSRLAPDAALFGSENVVEHALAWEGEALRVAWTAEDTPGSCCQVRAARIDCAAMPGAPLVTGVRLPDADTLSWDAAPGVSSYDVISGDLALLASTGDFAAATDACEVNDTPTTSLALPERTLPAWYLVRADEGSYGAARDTGIDASGSACP